MASASRPDASAVIAGNATVPDGDPQPPTVKSTTPPADISEAIHLHRQGNGEAAEIRYLAVLDADPDHPDALHFLGVLRHQQKRNDEAIELIERALTVAPGYVDAWNNVGNIFRSMDRQRAAEAAYRRAVELNDAHAGAWNNLAVVLCALKEYREAIAAHRRAIELAPEVGDWFYSYANTLREFGDPDAAVEAFRHALQLNPADRRSIVRVGYMLYLTGHREKAITAFREWVDAEPDNAEARHLLAACSGELPERAPEDYIRKMFDSFSDSFDEQLVKQLEYRAPALAGEMLRRQAESDLANFDILDAGCGTGLCAEHLRPCRSLTGVDLSPGMLEKASLRGGYDALHEGELTDHLDRHPATYDAVVSADTLVYIGNLEPVMRAARRALRPGGLLVFTTERGEGDGYSIGPHGRYAHGEAYLRRILEIADLDVIEIVNEILRSEVTRPVHGYVVAARAPAPGKPDA